MADLRTWVAAARPRTLSAAFVPVLVGTACAADVNPSGAWFNHNPDAGLTYPTANHMYGLYQWRFFAAVVVAVALQIGTNFARDHADGRRGTDDPDRRSGPPRLVGGGLAPAGHVRAAALISFGVAAVVGLAVAAAVDWWLIPVGVSSIAAGWGYAGGPWPYGRAGLGELTVFVFVGLVATAGSAFVQTGHLSPVDTDRFISGHGPSFRWLEGYPTLTVAAGAAVGLLAAAVLVVNNLRDIPADRAAGKRTLAVLLGDRGARVLYTVLLVPPFVIVAFIAERGGQEFTYLAVVAAVLAPLPLWRVWRGATGTDLNRVVRQTGRLQVTFGVLLAAGLLA